MATKKELLEGKTKDDLLKLAKKAGESKVKTSMRKGEMVGVLADSRKIRKRDL